MDQTTIYPVGNHLGSVTHLSNQPKIIDTKSANHFGLLLSTQQSIEEFQKKSGMLKAFTTEYQYHYWALVARIKVEDEVLDIAIPTVMFNYNQSVSGASVDFHLKDVEEASIKNAPVAEAIANVIVESSFGKYLQKTFGSTLEWMNVPMNTCHVHPGSLATFSSTDYKKNINDPGIVFPLSEPQEQPSFSSIICHSNDKHIAKVVRTEYRFANRNGLNINYSHGTCLAYWKGYTIPEYTIPGSKTKLPLIKSIFAGRQYDEVPDKVVAEEIKLAYINTDGTNPIVLENNAAIKGIIQEFNKLDFSPYTEDITADRFIKPTYGYAGTKRYGNTETTVYDQKNTTSAAMSIHDLRQELVTYGYAYKEVCGWDWYKCNRIYQELKEFEKKTTNTTSKTSHTDMSLEEMIKYMLANGISPLAVKNKTVAELEDMFENLIEKIEAAEKGPFDAKAVEQKPSTAPDLSNNEHIISLLTAHGLDRMTISNLDNNEISILFEELSA